MPEDNLYNIIKVAGIIFFVFLILFILVKSFTLQMKVMEGLTTGTSTSSTDSSSTSSVNGMTGSAVNYATEIKNQVIKLQDMLLISKYRADYENVIINMEDYINLLMLQNILNMNPSDPSKNKDLISNLNTLNGATTALNATMKYIDRA